MGKKESNPPPPEKIFKYELGSSVKDVLTKFKGVIGGRTQYFTGCVHYGIISRELKVDGSIGTWEWLDETRLALIPNVKRIVVKKDSYKPSGPMPNPGQN